MSMKMIIQKLDKIDEKTDMNTIKLATIEEHLVNQNGTIARHENDIKTNTNYRIAFAGGFAVVLFLIGIVSGWL